MFLLKFGLGGVLILRKLVLSIKSKYLKNLKKYIYPPIPSIRRNQGSI